MSDKPREALTRLQKVASVMGPWLARLLYATWRLQIVNDGPWRRLRATGKPFVLVLWHGQLLPLVVEHRGEGIKIVISEHRDGEVITRVARRLGLDAIRGSSSRGAARALLAMCEALESGGEIAVTPDGPRGPARTFAGGTLVAANRAHAPVVAIGVAASSAWRLSSWDSFMIPKPFARVAVVYSDPVFVSGENAREAVTHAAEFEVLMNATVNQAEASLASSQSI